MLIAEISESHLSCSSLAQLFHNGQIHAVVRVDQSQLTCFALIGPLVILRTWTWTWTLIAAC